MYVPETRVVIQPDTVEFLPHNSKMPFRSSAENATIAATELIHALRNPAPAAPYVHIGDAQMQVLDQLAVLMPLWVPAVVVGPWRVEKIS